MVDFETSASSANSGNEVVQSLTHLFPIHPFSTPWYYDTKLDITNVRTAFIFELLLCIHPRYLKHLCWCYFEKIIKSYKRDKVRLLWKVAFTNWQTCDLCLGIVIYAGTKIGCLTHFWLILFYPIRKYQKTSGFRTFLGGIKREQWSEKWIGKKQKNGRLSMKHL